MAIRTLKAFLYHNKSDERYVNKELEQLHPTDGEPVDGIPCILKDDTDLIRPTLIFNYHLVPNVNYIWLSEVARYYYVRNRTYSQERIYVHCEEDVLYTYRNELKKQDVILKRSENLFNQKQEDNEWAVYAYTAVRTINFPSGFNTGTPEYVLGIAGGRAT